MARKLTHLFYYYRHIIVIGYSHSRSTIAVGHRVPRVRR